MTHRLIFFNYYILFCIILLSRFGSAVYYENTYGEDYGEDWVLMMDEDGDSSYVDLTQLPYDQGRMIVGDVYFHLYTRNNADDYEELILDSEGYDENAESSFSSEYFDPNNDLKIITHGWMSSGNASCVTEIKDAYLRSSDLNVVAVDWHELAGNIIYPWAALSTRYVGKRVAKLISRINARYNTSGDQIHLIGHSLGAHVMGFAGAFSMESISRITGLDPARPFFEIPYFGPWFSLDESDADFVDVLHTCGGILGYRSAMGHADFFPNNGRPMQPGCGGVQPVLEACSHGRAYELFAESIETIAGFVSYPCGSWDSFQRGECTADPVLMGDAVDRAAQGSYYLYTNSEPKYAYGTNKNGTE